MAKRPKTLTDEQIDEVIALIEDGMPVAHAAKRVGCSRQAIYNRARRDPDFKQRVEMAQGRSFETIFKRMQVAAMKGKSWQAFAWILERVHGMTNPIEKAKLQAMKGRSKSAVEDYRRAAEQALSTRPARPEEIENRDAS